MDDILIEIMDNVLVDSWLELFIMIQTSKNTFKFGQLTMNLEVFEVPTETGQLIKFADVNNVKFGLSAKIDSKEDFDKFLKTFEADIDDFISLSDYERIENITFTGEARELISDSWVLISDIWGGVESMWINSEWSDHIDIP